ncbi:MAG: ATP-binding protein, partial [Ruthenibacterium sp.]
TSISQGENDVPLRNEMENIKSYLTIQKMRYGDKLAFELDVNERYLRYMVPKLILQPIVENALYHGIKLSPQAGTIRIGAFETEQMLVLTVSDNGVGMTAEQLSHIFEAKENGERGIGILNVHNRIKLCYGPQYGLQYFSETGTGTRVEIHLPADGKQEGAHEQEPL